MSLECDIAAKIVEKKRKQAEIAAINGEIKKLWYERGGSQFAVEIDGYAVTVKSPPNYGASWNEGKRDMPIAIVVELVEHCDVS